MCMYTIVLWYLYWQVRAASSGNGAGNGAPEQYDFDLFTIGAGSGGTRASRMAAQNHGRVPAASRGMTASQLAAANSAWAASPATRGGRPERSVQQPCDGLVNGAKCCGPQCSPSAASSGLQAPRWRCASCRSATSAATALVAPAAHACCAAACPRSSSCTRPASRRSLQSPAALGAH